jgi:uncharacterized membrane protein YdbT with pleckstrin-like domain
MSYVRSVLQPNEKILIIGKLHWILYVPALLAFFVVIALAVAKYRFEDGRTLHYLFLGAIALFGGITVVCLVRAWFVRWITEFAVTDRRVIYKRGFISRHTVEMNMDKIESVDVDQSLLGRLFNYGTIHVLGTGQGIESLRRIGAPLELRNAITAK